MKGAGSETCQMVGFDCRNINTSGLSTNKEILSAFLFCFFYYFFLF
jgi:hypothetical protein